VDYDDENNNENDGNHGDDDEFLSAWTRHGQNWSQICWATYQRPVLQPIFNRQPLIWSIRRQWQDVVIRGLFRTSMPFPSVKQPNLEATQPALALLQGWSPVWAIMLSLLRARRNRRGESEATTAMREVLGSYGLKQAGLIQSLTS
jgi:hypothetical protein